MKWMIKLGEHEIKYHPRNSINGQALADFLVEMLENKDMTQKDPEHKNHSPTAGFDPKEWMLSFDGASNEDGSGAGLLLINPEGIEFAYALHFEFFTTNNEAEYETVITGLELATKMKAQQVAILSDSQIVVNLINVSYEVRKPQLK